MEKWKREAPVGVSREFYIGDGFIGLESHDDRDIEVHFSGGLGDSW